VWGQPCLREGSGTEASSKECLSTPQSKAHPTPSLHAASHQRLGSGNGKAGTRLATESLRAVGSSLLAFL